jgi:peptide/nickel transport system permease protein/oligopeptide transport system permease protein
MPKQIINFYKDLLSGDLGVSNKIQKNVPVTEILAPKLPVSIKLGSASLLLSLALGIPFGILMTKYKGKFFDKFGTLFIVFIQAAPAVVYYLFIQFYGTSLFGVPLRYEENVGLGWWLLPVFSMSLGNIAYYGMWIRRYMVDELNKDYVRLARAKGVSEGKIMFRHVFKNAFVPMVQYIPTSFLNTVIGSIYVESLYSINGMGGLLVSAVQRSDNNLVQAIVLLYATVGIIGLLLGDVLMAIIDPRIKLSGKGGDR